MKQNLYNKKSRIAILVTLILVALAEVLFRAIAVGALALSTANAGEQITVIAFALITLIFTAKGNDKIAYICCGALIAYFVMDQLFELPGVIENLIANISEPHIVISIAIRLLTMVGVVVIAVLLAEYVNDGSIYNRAYKVTYWATILLHVASVLFSVSAFFAAGTVTDAPSGAELAVLQNQGVLIIFNDLYRIVMVVLFTSFAYDSANRQLKREALAE